MKGREGGHRNRSLFKGFEQSVAPILRIVQELLHQLCAFFEIQRFHAGDPATTEAIGFLIAGAASIAMAQHGGALYVVVPAKFILGQC